MAADLPNRETARDELLTLLQASIGTATVAAYYNYRVGDFAGQSPTLIVSSGPAKRERMSYAGSLISTTFEYDVYVFVLYVDPSGTAWAEADAEDRLDLIEKEVADCVQDNRSGTVWQQLDWVDTSAIDSVVLGGAEYKREVIRLSARI